MASNLAIQSGPLARQGSTLNGQRASLTDANGNATLAYAKLTSGGT